MKTKTTLNEKSFFEKQPLTAFILGLAVALVATYLIKDDVISTAETLFNYLPIKFDVRPTEAWEGALVLGAFTSLVQAIAMGIMPMKDAKTGIRISALVIFIIFLPIDNWSDIVHRSNYLSGNIWVAVGTTFIFYTFGSEIAAGLGWFTAFKFFRPAISQLMLLSASFFAFFGIVKAEWSRYMQVARNKANRYLGEREQELMSPNYGASSQTHSSRRTSRSRPSSKKRKASKLSRKLFNPGKMK